MKAGVMDEIRQRLLEYRDKLVCAYDAQQGKNNKYAQGVATVTRALLKDFDRTFSPSILKDSSKNLQPIIDKFCNPDKKKCPICGADNVRKRTHHDHSAFLGCSRYPDCKGARYPDGRVTVNDVLRFFLTQRVREETLQEEAHEESRFHNLDL